MNILAEISVIFRGVNNDVGPWIEMKIIYRKSRTAEHVSYSVIISHVHVQARSSLLIIVWKIVLLVPSISNSSCMWWSVRDVRTIPHHSLPVDIIVAHEYYWSRLIIAGRGAKQYDKWFHIAMGDGRTAHMVGHINNCPLKMLIPTFYRARRAGRSWGRGS